MQEASQDERHKTVGPVFLIQRPVSSKEVIRSFWMTQPMTEMNLDYFEYAVVNVQRAPASARACDNEASLLQRLKSMLPCDCFHSSVLPN